jgi:hypothetical protein
MSAEVRRELRRRLAVLRLLNRNELLAMPPASTEEVQPLDGAALFTTYIERHPGGRLLVLARSDQQGILGLITYGSTEGFWVQEDGVILEASEKDIRDFGS